MSTGAPDPGNVDPSTGGFRTPLFDVHAEFSGRMANFGGHALPMRFEGTVAEHQHTRSAAGLFDVSHMGIVDIRPADGASVADVAEWLERSVPGSIVNLGPGRMRYTQLTTPSGGVLDDLIVSNLGDRLRLVVNAVRTDADLALLRSRCADTVAHESAPAVTIEVQSGLALLALQGPTAAAVLSRWAPGASELPFMATASLDVNGVPCEVSRCGYTGEDGFEITVPAVEASSMARLLLSSDDVVPAGLGARDTLRLEAGLPLVGHELTESTSVAEAGLGWSIPKRRRTKGGFPGAEVIAEQLAAGPSRRRVGISAVGRRPIRDAAALSAPDGTPVGVVTSGGYGPTIDAPIAMAYVAAEHADVGTELVAAGRRGDEPCIVAELPFVEHRFWRPS